MASEWRLSINHSAHHRGLRGMTWTTGSLPSPRGPRYPSLAHSLHSLHSPHFPSLPFLVSSPYRHPIMPHLKLIADLPGHSEPAWSVIFNPTKPIIASSSTDKTVRIYSYSFPNDNEEEGGVEDGGDGHGETKAKSEQKLLPIIHYHSTLPTSSHKRTIRSLAFSPSGSTLATGSFDSSIGIWEERIPEEEGEGGIDETSGVEPINTQRGEGEEKQWENVTTLDGHESEVKSVGFSSDGGLLASCSWDKCVWFWDGE